jgi:hypothetical protein
MELLQLPPSLVENRGLPAIARQVAAAVFVCKAPPDEQHIASFVLVGFGQRHQAVVHERTDEVLAFLEDELEVLLSGKSAVGHPLSQDIAELDGVRHAGGDH